MIRRAVGAVLVVAWTIVATGVAPEVVGAQSRAAAAEAAGKVNINSATAKELMTLSGVGEKVAQRIVQFREANGPFKSVDDLKRVDGIGGALIEKNRPRLVVK